MAWTQRASDTFTDTDGTSLASHTPDQGSSWTVDSGTWTINSNQLRVDGASSSVVARNTTSLGGDQAAQINNIFGVVQYIGVFVRASSGNGYLLLTNAGVVSQFYKLVSGTYTQLGSDMTRCGAVGTESLRLEVTGTTLYAYCNGSLLGSVSDSTFSSGQVGLFANDAVATNVMDAFVAEDDISGGNPSRLLLLGVR